jgi:hypothetical protein
MSTVVAAVLKLAREYIRILRYKVMRYGVWPCGYRLSLLVRQQQRSDTEPRESYRVI